MIRLLLSVALISDVAAAQRVAPDDLAQPSSPPPMQTVQTIDPMAQGRAAAARGDMAEALSRYLRVLAAHPDDVAALIGAGQAALAVGDFNAANGFFARADSLSPNNGAVKAGLGSVLVAQGNSRDSLRYFKAAIAAGMPEARIAADRGLAYDLRGSPHSAQADYRLALSIKPGDPMILRRLALSQAIAGEQGAALATLDPLLRRQDVAAWRTRMFVRALAGDIAGAESDAPLVLPPNQVAALKPYLERLQGLKPADKAAAVFLGRFPPPGQVAVKAPPPVRIAAAPAPSAPALVVSPPAPPPTPAATVDTGTVAPPPARKLTRAEAAKAAREAKLAAVEAEPPHKLTRAEKLKQAREEKLADARAAKDKKAAEAKSAAKKNPERVWVQIAGGANKRDLPKAWAKLKGEYGAALAGRTPYTMHYRYTNRLMIGPFAGSSAAQAWIKEQRAKGHSSFQVTTPSGTPVEPVD
ncbi:Flp pilus assembly protein TadD [Sphingomonas vulcanisoli]|uniref:Flp pilus assembly protein TadD n=1 Tax=Sphingomonas vulcanisoli TaxID=1658060 RepID=A0ABX0TVU3_9SPHN|nr:SPOR domain-containing protein [Sphingomonas vulcanisoli]NIJ07900.1 Flp pilus assembly protein TadD [Sphingomonas vulcanisoli]